MNPRDNRFRPEARGDVLIWEDNHNDFIAYLSGIGGLEDPQVRAALRAGTKLAQTWPRTAFVTMLNQREHRRYTRLGDAMAASPPIVSAALADHLRARHLPDLELLPVHLRNGTDRLPPCFVVHLTSACDCIDVDASQVSWNTIRPTLIDGCRSLVLKRDALPEGHLLLRPRHLEHVVLIRRELADELLDRRFTGLRFMHPEDYTGAGYLGNRCHREPT